MTTKNWEIGKRKLANLSSLRREASIIYLLLSDIRSGLLGLYNQMQFPSLARDPFSGGLSARKHAAIDISILKNFSYFDLKLTPMATIKS